MFYLKKKALKIKKEKQECQKKKNLIENIVSWALLGTWNTLFNRTLKVYALYQFLHEKGEIK